MLYIINIGKEKPQSGLPIGNMKNTSTMVKITDVFFIVYLLLLKIIANAIIKAVDMTVTIIKEKNNM